MSNSYLCVEQDLSEGAGDEEAVEQVLDPDWLDAELDLDRLDPELDPESLPDLRDILQ